LRGTPAPVDPLSVRRRFASRLAGEGIEIGPGHVPFPVPPGVTVRFVDRWTPADNEALFPELGGSPGFPSPHYVANLDTERLSGFGDGTQDFVIASHILEHLANPLALLVDIHRVLRSKGVLILLLPDRHSTFDRERDPTPLTHVVAEYRSDVREVDDAHIIDQLVGAHRANGGTFDPGSLTPEQLELHRHRSVHAHVWDIHEFTEVLEFASKELDVDWEVLDEMLPGQEGTYGEEFGWVLARS